MLFRSVFLSETEHGLQGLLDSFDTNPSDMALRINAGKTKIVVFDGSDELTGTDILLHGERLEEVKEFVYLGRVFQKNGKIDAEIDRKVCAGRKVVGSMRTVARSETLSLRAKLAVYSTVLLPTVLYGSESWVCGAMHRSKLNAVGMSFLRASVGKSRWDRVRNDWVKSKCNVKDDKTDI